MKEAIIVQGRQLEAEEIERIRRLIQAHPEWSRRQLSEVLAAQWDWRNGAGQLKDMATRSLLLKLEARGWIELPARRQKTFSRMAQQALQGRLWDRSPLQSTLRELGPPRVQEVSRKEPARTELAAAFAEFHYLGYRGSVGENLQYTITDCRVRLLAGLTFGAPAWKCGDRDHFIGWSGEERARSLHLVTNNTRFLILPWVGVPHLASWALGQVLRRLSADWQHKYGHPIVLVETFVERERFAATSYRAANWVRVGTTRGRTRQDRDHTVQVPVKDVYLYPLVRDFRSRLRS